MSDRELTPAMIERVQREVYRRHLEATGKLPILTPIGKPGW